MYKNDNGPIIGLCPMCGNPVRLVWRDRIKGEYRCTTCGETFDNPGFKRVATRDEIHRTMDRAWDIVGVSAGLPLYVFLQLVDDIIFEEKQARISRIKKSDINLWGYTICCGVIRRG